MAENTVQSGLSKTSDFRKEVRTQDDFKTSKKQKSQSEQTGGEIEVDLKQGFVSDNLKFVDAWRNSLSKLLIQCKKLCEL
jgi:hypothetical protein